MQVNVKHGLSSHILNLWILKSPQNNDKLAGTDTDRNIGHVKLDE